MATKEEEKAELAAKIREHDTVLKGKLSDLLQNQVGAWVIEPLQKLGYTVTYDERTPLRAVDNGKIRVSVTDDGVPKEVGNIRIPSRFDLEFTLKTKHVGYLPNAGFLRSYELLEPTGTITYRAPDGFESWRQTAPRKLTKENAVEVVQLMQNLLLEGRRRVGAATVGLDLKPRIAEILMQPSDVPEGVKRSVKFNEGADLKEVTVSDEHEASYRTNIYDLLTGDKVNPALQPGYVLVLSKETIVWRKKPMRYAL